jgi:hypothetical protein
MYFFACVFFFLLQMRVFSYMVMSALQDEETQKKGVVIVYYALGQKRAFGDRPFELMKSWRSIPWRVVAFHSCADSSVIDVAAYLLCSLMDNSNVCSFRAHIGKAFLKASDCGTY